MHDLVARVQIFRLEDAIRLLPKFEPVVVHSFAPGVYAREIHIPAGVVLTGKIHRTEHLNILSAGKVEVYNNGETKTMQAPFTFVSPVGTKRALFAVENTVWTTIHATDETDIDVLEAELIVESFELLDAEQRELLS